MQRLQITKGRLINNLWRLTSEEYNKLFVFYIRKCGSSLCLGRNSPFSLTGILSLCLRATPLLRIGGMEVKFHHSEPRYLMEAGCHLHAKTSISLGTQPWYPELKPILEVAAYKKLLVTGLFKVTTSYDNHIGTVDNRRL